MLVGRGHAPEMLCLFSPEHNVLIAGDQVLPKISPNVSVWPSEPEANPLAEFLDSLASFRQLPADCLVLPSHGLPFRGSARADRSADRPPPGAPRAGARGMRDAADVGRGDAAAVRPGARRASAAVRARRKPGASELSGRAGQARAPDGLGRPRALLRTFLALSPASLRRLGTSAILRAEGRPRPAGYLAKLLLPY